MAAFLAIQLLPAIEIGVSTLSWQSSLSYRNQSTDLQSKSMDWFLYDRELHHERVKQKEIGKNEIGLYLVLFRFYVKDKHSKDNYEYPISELARPLCFPAEIFRRWCKLDFGS